MNNIIIATFGIVALVISILVLILSPKESKYFNLPSDDSEMDATIRKVLNLIGGDVAYLGNTQIKRMSKDGEIEKLLVSSGNPWNINVQEFVILRFVIAIMGFVFGIALGIVFGIVTGFFFLSPAPAILFAFLGWLYPKNAYEGRKKQREMEFKAKLPEAIDYLIMILSGGGYSLPVAFEMSLDYLPIGVVKEEFTKIVSDLHTGQTMEMALNSFAERVPSEGIKSFVKALNNANKLSVSVVEILKARAFASRKELETEIEKRVTGLPVKVMLVLSPASAASIIIIAISPSISAIMNML